MNSTLILLPVVVQIILTLVMFIFLAVRKAKAIKAGEADTRKTALNNDAWPDYVLKVSNNIRNQFQTPVLFYILVFAFLATNSVTLTVLVLACIYALSRIFHAYVHIGSNYVPLRLRLFLVGSFALFALTGILAFNLVDRLIQVS